MPGLGCGDAAAADLGGLAVSPGIGAGGVGVQQDAGATRFSAGTAEPLNDVLANLAFLVRKPDDVLLEHECSSFEADSLRQPPQNILCLNVRFDKTLGSAQLQPRLRLGRIQGTVRP